MVEAEGLTFPFAGEDAVTPDLLETFPYEYPEREALVEVSTDEWTCVCPFSGLPDFGTLRVRYLPSAACIELKSLKYYLTSFRNVGIYQEHAANRLLELNPASAEYRETRDSLMSLVNPESTGDSLSPAP